jgi:hypothetical protein
MSTPRLERLALFVVAAVSTVAFALIVAGPPPAGATGAIDLVGHYVMTDSTDPGGPRFHPIQSGDFHDLHQEDDTESTTTLPFPFTFYGTTFTTVTIAANGTIAFPAGQQVGFHPLALNSVDSHMVGWWSDWNPGADEEGYVLIGTRGVAPHRTFVVWWNSVANHNANGLADFQLQLFEGSNRIELHVLHTVPSWSSFPIESVIGIDNGTTSSLQHNLAGPPDEFVVRFEPQNCLGRAATVFGTFGDDHLVGTPGNDVIVAGDGNDTVDGGGGNDLICGGRGDDRVNGGVGRDRVLGGRGSDDARGGLGADRLEGGLGRDVCRGGPGQDVALGCEVRRGTP